MREKSGDNRLVGNDVKEGTGTMVGNDIGFSIGF